MFVSQLKQSTAFRKYVHVFSGFKVESSFLKIVEFLLSVNSWLPYFHLSFFVIYSRRGFFTQPCPFKNTKR